MAALHHTLPATAAPPLRIRDLGPADEPLLDELHAGAQRAARTTSASTAPKPRLAPRERAYLAATDGRDHVALVAPTAAARRSRSPASCGCADRPQAADIAAEVVDALQSQGIGSDLIARLARRAAAVGIRRFTATVLSRDRPAALARAARLEGRRGGRARAPRSRSTCGRCSAPR